MFYSETFLYETPLSDAYCWTIFYYRSLALDLHDVDVVVLDVDVVLLLDVDVTLVLDVDVVVLVVVDAMHYRE